MSNVQQRAPDPRHAFRPERRQALRVEAEAPFALDEGAAAIGLDLLLLPGFDLFDLAVAQEITGAFNAASKGARFSTRMRSVGDASVHSSCGITVAADPTPGDAPNLLILGGTVEGPEQFQRWRFPLRRAVYGATRIFSAGGATFALAGAGLLDQQPAAAPWRSVDAWQALHPKVRFVSREWAGDRKFRSCLGGRALIRMLLECVAQQFGHQVADAIARNLNTTATLRTSPETAEGDCVPPHCHPALHEAIRAIRGSLGEPLAIGHLCALSGGASQRKLQRLFRRHLGTTIGRYSLSCRLQNARELLRLTAFSVTEVAFAAGFESPTHFSRCYSRHFGHAPKERRRPQPG
jgi:transcriptional regulator GlxA family with amidase domain